MKRIMADVIRKLSNIIAFENQIQTCDAMIIIIFQHMPNYRKFLEKYSKHVGVKWEETHLKSIENILNWFKIRNSG